MGGGGSKDTTATANQPKPSNKKETTAPPKADAADKNKAETKDAKPSDGAKDASANKPAAAAANAQTKPATSANAADSKPANALPPKATAPARTDTQYELEAQKNNWPVPNREGYSTPVNPKFTGYQSPDDAMSPPLHYKYIYSGRSTMNEGDPNVNWGDIDEEREEPKEEKQVEKEEKVTLPDIVESKMADLKKKIDEVKANPGLNVKGSRENVCFIFETFREWGFDPTVAGNFYKRVIQYKFVEMHQIVWKQIFTEDLFSQTQAKIYDSADLLLTCFWNLCEHKESQAVALERIARLNFDHDLIEYLSGEVMKGHKLSQTNSRSQTAKAFIDILHRLAKDYNVRKAELRRFGAVDALQAVRDSRNPTLMSSAMLVQSLLISETQNEQYNTKPETFKMLASMLELSIKKTPYHLDTIFEENHVLISINRLASMDANVPRLVATKIPKYYMYLLKSQDGELVFLAAKGLWLMAYKGKRELASEYGLTKALRATMYHEDAMTGFGAEGALWIIKDKIKESAELYLNSNDSTNARQHRGLPGPVYVSTREGTEAKANRLIVRLNEAEISAISSGDFDLAGMTDRCAAIEDCSFFLMVTSEEYKESPLARFEVEYARLLAKKKFVLLMMDNDYQPDGWLQEYEKESKPFDFKRDEKFEDSSTDVIKAIRSVYPQENMPDVIMSRDGTFIADDDLMTARSIDDRNIPYPWTKEQVMQWFDDNDLSDMKDKCSMFDGPLLAELLRLRYEVPQAYYQQMFKQFSTPQVLRMSQALRRLRKRAQGR